MGEKIGIGGCASKSAALRCVEVPPSPQHWDSANQAVRRELARVS